LEPEASASAEGIGLQIVALLNTGGTSGFQPPHVRFQATNDAQRNSDALAQDNGSAMAAHPHTDRRKQT
jgi:hypothetical protein